MSTSRSCPALFVSAPASGQGKTTVTAALARWHRNRGHNVRVFKTGPDFLDPMILERASGNPVHQLDLWMGGEQFCRRLLYEAAGDADLILIEGVMGLFDGEPCSADLAALFGIPILAAIDATAMAQTFGAVAQGLSNYRQGLPFAGIVANRIAGERHFSLVKESLPPGLHAIGWLPRNADIALPERHLGLVQADEIDDLDARIECAAELFKPATNSLPGSIVFTEASMDALPKMLRGVRIAVARDAAFSFIYRANLEVLHALGAELCFFSPLGDHRPPEADAIYLPGGFPELHCDRLAANQTMKEAIRAHHACGKPLLAECGGMLYLLDSLTNVHGHKTAMAGLLPGRAAMQTRLKALALQSVNLPEGELRGHTFHHSRLESPVTPIACGHCPNGGKTGEAVYRQGRLTASYIHLYFASNPVAAARLLLP